MEGEGWNGLIQGLQNQNQEQQLNPPHRCPRCNSMNTKFCYFNNYNLSQPRYFCKACRRYWTQGGTLRNVPFGGGCRRGRRARVAASSGESVRSLPATSALRQLAPAPVLQPVQLQPNLTSVPPNVVPSNHVLAVRESEYTVPTFAMAPLMTPYYHGPAVNGGGYLSSLLSNNKSLNMGAAGTSNFSAMPGVSINPFSYQQQLRQIQPQTSYQMNNWERNISAMYQRQPGLTQSGMPAGCSAYQPYWSQNSMNDANHTVSVSDASVPNSMNTTSMNANPNSSRAAGSSLVTNHWPKMPEYEPSP